MTETKKTFKGPGIDDPELARSWNSGIDRNRDSRTGQAHF